MIVDPTTLGPPVACGTPWRRACGVLFRLTGSACHLAHRHWLLYGLTFSIWILAYVRVFIDPTPHLPLLFNWTPSVPYKVALVQYGNPRALGRGDFIIYAFDGQAQQHYPGLRSQPFFKQILGMPGDRITVTGRQIFVNGVSAGVAKAATFDGRPLTPIGAMVIPRGCYYVQGIHPDSFDSRYRESGLVHAGQVLGRVIPLF